jgi:hypothetical protein
MRRSRPRFPHDVHRRSQAAGQPALRDRGARPLVGEDLRKGGDEVTDGPARRPAVDLGFEDVAARLRHATDIRHLGLDLEAFGVAAAQLVERPLGEFGQKRGIEHLVDAAAALAHGGTVPARL